MLIILRIIFLTDPLNQFKKMFELKRLIATLTYLLMIALSLFFSLVLKSGFLVYVCIILQYFAMTWYAISYIS